MLRRRVLDQTTGFAGGSKRGRFMAERWTLWSDESRRGGDGPLVAAGMFLHDDAEETLAAVRWEIESQLPWVPWPLHATEFHRPGMQLVWLSAAGNAVPPGLEEPVDRCVARCKKSPAAAAFGRLSARRDSGRSNAKWMEDCAAVEAVFFHVDDPAWERVVEVSRIARRWLQSLFLEAARSIQADQLGYLVAGTDSDPSPTVDMFLRAKAGLRQSEWTEVVTQLASRCVDLLAAAPEETVVALSPLAHDAKHAETSARRQSDPSALLDGLSRELTENRTGQANTSRAIALRNERTNARVSVQPTERHAYDRQSPVAHIWADWLAFELRSKLRTSRSLGALAGACVATVGWSILPAPGIVTVTASGPSAVRLGCIRRKQAVPPEAEDAETLEWAGEQVDLFAARLSVWRLT